MHIIFALERRTSASGNKTTAAKPVYLSHRRFSEPSYYAVQDELDSPQYYAPRWELGLTRARARSANGHLTMAHYELSRLVAKPPQVYVGSLQYTGLASFTDHIEPDLFLIQSSPSQYWHVHGHQLFDPDTHISFNPVLLARNAGLILDRLPLLPINGYMNTRTYSGPVHIYPTAPTASYVTVDCLRTHTQRRTNTHRSTLFTDPEFTTPWNPHANSSKDV